MAIKGQMRNRIRLFTGDISGILCVRGGLVAGTGHFGSVYQATKKHGHSDHSDHGENGPYGPKDPFSQLFVRSPYASVTCHDGSV